MTVAGAFCQPLTYPKKVAIVADGIRDSAWLSPNTFKPSKYKPKSLEKDTLIPKNLHRGYLYEDVKLLQQKPQKYIGNNGKGSDIYQDQLDNMYVLKPDKSFSSIMPNALNQVLLTDSISMQLNQLPRVYRSPKPIQ